MRTKRTIISGILVICCISLSSCGGSISSDAQKVADLQCEAMKLQQEVISGDTSSSEEAKEFMAEASALVQKMNAKYSSFEEKQEFQQALMEAKADCN